MVRVLPALIVILATTVVAAAGVAQDKPAPAAKSPAAATAVVNLNTATAAQIATLPGIGEKAAQRIIEYREKNGGFKKVEELMNVKGIGEKSFLKLKTLITVTDPKAAKQ